MKEQMKTKTCEYCGLPLTVVKHIEHDGFDGSDESYYVCPIDCRSPKSVTITPLKLTYLVISKNNKTLIKFFYENNGEYAEFKMEFKPDVKLHNPDDLIGVHGAVEVYSNNPDNTDTLIKALTKALQIN